jgi:hypothetical protein
MRSVASPRGTLLLNSLTVAVLCSCSPGSGTSVIEDPVLNSVTLSPDAVALQANAAQQFSVTGEMSDGSSVTPSVTFSSTGGNIASDGLYIAGATAGSFRVIAAAANGVADTSAVTITIPTATLTQVILTPARVSLSQGATQQFSVSGVWSDGSNSAPAVTYTATGGTITAGGLYTGGSSDGSFRVIATQQGGALADTSAVTITTVSGGAVDTVWHENFESGSLASWGDRGFEQNHAVVAPPGGAFEGTLALQVTYPQGSDGGWLTHFFMPGYDSIYARYYVKLESSWQGGTKLSSFYGSRADDQWSAAGKSGVCPNGTDFFQVTLTGDPSPQMWLRFYDQYFGMPSNGGDCFGSNGDAGTIMTPGQFQLTTGVWHKVEYWTRLNDPSLTNSVQEFKIDGVTRGTWTGIKLRTSTILKLNAFTLTMSAPLGAPHTQHVWVDDILIARQRPGP